MAPQQYPGAKGGGWRYSSGSQCSGSCESFGSDLAACEDRALTSTRCQPRSLVVASLQLEDLVAFSEETGLSLHG